IICQIDEKAEPATEKKSTVKAEKKAETKAEVKAEDKPKDEDKPESAAATPPSVATPTALSMMTEHNIQPSLVHGTGSRGRITKADVMSMLTSGFGPTEILSRSTKRQKMSMLRKKLAERLVSVKNETAMLTTFNEVDMTAMMELRKTYKDAFEKKHGVGLGYMSFFTKAVTEALAQFPAVNSMIDGDEMVFHDYADIGIAVSTPKGLMVPILRNAENMSFAEIEKGIKNMATKAREGKITIEEMSGGTFTITNGGVFGSLMSTPIINPPQVAILGMHKIQERVMVINGEMKIRPMMYIALSYDHRVIDGRESVGFLVKVKELLENPVSMLFFDKTPNDILFDL
ncbi:MAG: dihydrolipoyllysine-residue succinyltransferase, partial [Flavobacteriales bacterium]|nr:dihydrolipoyllysine-residue succinyltransferase [Flavobacteriales bacterium]